MAGAAPGPQVYVPSLVTQAWTRPLRCHSTPGTPLTAECREKRGSLRRAAHGAGAGAWPRGQRLDCPGTGQDEKAQLLWVTPGQTDLLGEGGAEAKCC